MAHLNDIAAGKLLEQEIASLPEVVAHLILYEGCTSRQSILQKVQPMIIDLTDDDILSQIEQVDNLTKIVMVFKTIQNIADMLSHARSRLVKVTNPASDTVSYASEEDWNFRSYLEAVVDESTGRDDRPDIMDGIMAHAAIKWYAVRTRYLMGSVGGCKAETDWFWQTFGEYHHRDLIAFRDQLVHVASPEHYTPVKLLEQCDWFVDWMAILAAMIRRTSVSVPDATGMTKMRFPTAEMAQLPKAEGDDQLSASNALVSITLELNRASSHPCKFSFIHFDPETRMMTFPQDLNVRYSKLV